MRRDRPKALGAYAIIMMVLASCGHERLTPRRASRGSSSRINTSDIPWVNAQTPNKDQFLFADVPRFASNIDENQNDGASQNNIRSEREVFANIVASMPYAMPFYCDPACYEPSIILALQDCQPYIPALYYFLSNPPPPLPIDDEDIVIYEPGLPFYRGRPLLNRAYARDRIKGYCIGR